MEQKTTVRSGRRSVGGNNSEQELARAKKSDERVGVGRGSEGES